ncbi:NAD(P)H-quinone oxidoreductase subunit 2, chloroplastic [subsurface metagenome]
MIINILLIPILLPIAAGTVILFIPRKVRWIREILAVLTTAAVFASALKIFLVESPGLHVPLLEIRKFYLSFDLAASPLSSFILIFLTGFAFLISLYSLSFMAGRNRLKEYYAFILFALAGSCGVLMADHFLFFLIFWEIVTASLYFLVTTGGPEAKAGATKTFAMLGGADGCLLMGIGILWYLSNSFTISAIQVSITGWLSGIAFILMMIGAIAKAGAMPLHTWIPAASEGAPASVMAFLPAALDKLLGIYLLVRIALHIFVMNSAMGLVLMIIGAVTIVAAVMVAMVQHDLKRLLSYHAVSQVGYMVLGIGTMTPIGLAGGLFHMLNNSIYKSCLFLCAGAVEKKTGSTDLGELGGLARAMPVTFITCLVSALAISGIPPFNGFVSKWLIYQGSIGSGGRFYLIFLIAAMFGSALTLASFIKVIYSVFLSQKSEKTLAVKKDVGFAMQLPLVVLALICLVFGIYYRFPLQSFIYPGIGLQAVPTGIWNSTLATGLILIGLILGLVIYLVGNFLKSARVAGAFVGGETGEISRSRASGTHFYDTIKFLPSLRKIYAAQERGHFDPYVQLGRLGSGITGLLKILHNGLLPWYLSWSLLGAVVLLFLFIFLP